MTPVELKYLSSITDSDLPSEGDQIKAAIRELFCARREGTFYSPDNPMIKIINRVNGQQACLLQLYILPTDKDAVVLKYIGKPNE